MFEQAQIQEFKEVSVLTHPLPCRSWSWPPSLLLPVHPHSLTYPLVGWGLPPPRTVVSTPQAFSCIDQNRDGIICKSDLRETYSQLGEHSPPAQPAHSLRGPAERGQASLLPPLPSPHHPTPPLPPQLPLTLTPTHTPPLPPPHTQRPLILCPWLGRRGGGLSLAGDTPGPCVRLMLTPPHQGR